ncbi:unnamed protein product, partial [Closterium sp. Naga37s-1]
SPLYCLPRSLKPTEPASLLLFRCRCFGATCLAHALVPPASHMLWCHLPRTCFGATCLAHALVPPASHMLWCHLPRTCFGATCLAHACLAHALVPPASHMPNSLTASLPRSHTPSLRTISLQSATCSSGMVRGSHAGEQGRA